MATTKVLPAKLNYKILRGDDFADVVTIKENGSPIDVSTREFAAQVRSTPDGDVVAEMDIDMSSAASGEVGYSIPDTDTADMSGQYVWDFQQTVFDITRTLIAGTFTVEKDVTRSE
jgi:hypothetical protein